jgi:N5-(cytidine 5'-diphosphoramidyl)-L-glutamine hydrolase
MNDLRLGLTTRVVNAINYHEIRDCIARDWIKYANVVFPDSKWLLIPNGINNIEEYVNKWDLNAFIFTGGETIGSSPERDETERLIYEYCRINNYPILGICRGLQVLYHLSGGSINGEQKESTSYTHVATKHEIQFMDQLTMVNSYHNNLLDESTCPPILYPIARCTTDGTIEAVYGENMLGLMWHPEREEHYPEWEINLIRDFFKRQG